ncbi:hypothetical protein bcgnr5372_41490 [Bacillus luti]
MKYNRINHGDKPNALRNLMLKIMPVTHTIASEATKTRTVVNAHEPITRKGKQNIIVKNGRKYHKMFQAERLIKWKNGIKPKTTVKANHAYSIPAFL